ncbi:MAG: N-acetyl-gamma-glutamyl-phosphate reductase [Hyphomicrobiales bacterium]
MLDTATHRKVSQTSGHAKIFIDGEAGTTGLQIRERLSELADVALISIEAAMRKDVSAKREVLEDADLVILCLPDAAARESVALIEAMGDKAPRIIDASTAHRTAPGWVFGFPEMVEGQAEAIRGARKVSNPGCYSTAAIALIRPLVDKGLIPADQALTINAVSGYSGGGKSMIEAHERGDAPSFELYGLGFEHKHVPEIHAHSGLTRRPVFIPSVGNYRQGMLVSVPLFLDLLPGKPKAADLQAALRSHYGEGGTVRVVAAEPPNSFDRLEAESLNGTNLLELRVVGSKKYPQALLIAKLDNLGKGASGAAVQSMRLMLGL